MSKDNNRDYSKLEWDDLTKEEQKRFKVRYTVLKLTEAAVVIGVIYGIYYLFFK